MVFKSSLNNGGSGGVTTVDGIAGAVTLVQGSNITISDNTPVAGSITIASTAGGGNVNTTGSPVLGNIAIFSGSTTITNGDLAGDATTNGSPTITLATVNSNVGSYGSTNSAPIITVNAKGLVTGVSTVSLGTGSVTTTGSPSVGNLAIFSGATSITNTNLVGDVTTSGGSTSTLATVNSNIGSYGSSSSVPIVTVNAKGLTTGISTASYLGSALSGTILAAGILTSSLTQVGTLATATWQASTITVPYGGTGLATLTAHGVMLGEGTSNVSFATIGTSGRLFVDNGSGNDPSFVALVGDATLTNNATLTLATVNSNVGSYGSVNSIPILTVNAKGLTTAVSTATINAPAGNLTGATLASNVLNSSLTKVGTLATATWNATTITVPYGGSGLSTLTAHAVMLGEGTSNVAFATIGTSGNILTDQGSGNDPKFVAVVGDATLTGNATLTLATVNSQIGTYGSSVSAPIITVNAKGLITAVSTVSIAAGTGTVTTTGTPGVGNIAIFSGATSITNTNLAGDATTSGGSTLTFATVNSNVGSYGSTNSIPIVTVNAKGLTTAVSTASITVATSGLPVNQTYREIAFALDGQGSAIASGGTWYLAQIPYSGNISTWSLVADQSGSINIDVWKKNAAVPTVSSTITSAFLPGLTSTQAVYAQTIQGWSSTVTAGDCFGFKVNAATTVQKISLTLQITAS